jgi:hypothetical protein
MQPSVFMDVAQMKQLGGCKHGFSTSCTCRRCLPWCADAGRRSSMTCHARAATTGRHSHGHHASQGMRTGGCPQSRRRQSPALDCARPAAWPLASADYSRSPADRAGVIMCMQAPCSVRGARTARRSSRGSREAAACVRGCHRRREVTQPSLQHQQGQQTPCIHSRDAHMRAPLPSRSVRLRRRQTALV